MFKQIVKMETKQAQLETGLDMLLDYYILIDELVSSENIALENYGVRVVKSVKNGIHTQTECCDIAVITPFLKEIKAIITLLSVNTVTPISVEEVISDMLAG